MSESHKTASSNQNPGESNSTFPETAGSQEPSKMARLPQQLAAELGVGYILGRSVKVLHKTLLRDRYLLTVPKNKIPLDPNGRVLDLCRRLNMPAQLLTAMTAKLPSANYVHFGIEESHGACIYKIYLEFWTNWTNELDVKRRSEPFLGGYGFKWDALNNARQVLTEYTCYPLLPRDRMLDRVSQIYTGPNSGSLMEIMRSIVDLISSRMPELRILYLEAAEGNNPRRSFDINGFQARIKLEELRDTMQSVCSHFAIDSGNFDELYSSIKDERFGHVAGGTDRAGRDFMTIYYGMEQH